jgi:hypothetical protein
MRLWVPRSTNAEKSPEDVRRFLHIGQVLRGLCTTCGQFESALRLYEISQMKRKESQFWFDNMFIACRDASITYHAYGQTLKILDRSIQGFPLVEVKKQAMKEARKIYKDITGLRHAIAHPEGSHDPKYRNRRIIGRMEIIGQLSHDTFSYSYDRKMHEIKIHESTLDDLIFCTKTIISSISPRSPLRDESGKLKIDQTADWEAIKSRYSRKSPPPA